MGGQPRRPTLRTGSGEKLSWLWLGALLEAAELGHRDGRIVNANIADWLVPVNADMPESA